MKFRDFKEAAGVGIITKQNATKDVPVGGEYMNVKKLGLGKGKPKQHSKKTKGSKTNVLFNLGMAENEDIKENPLIGTFHPHLTAGQLLEVERKMAVTKKKAFERWVEKSFRKKINQASKERNRFARERFIRGWREWLTLETTHQAFLPFAAIIVISIFAGWSIGISNNSCTPYFPTSETGILK